MITAKGPLELPEGVHSCLDLRLQPPGLGGKRCRWSKPQSVAICYGCSRTLTGGSWEPLVVITSHRFGAQGHVRVGLGIKLDQGEAGRKQSEPPFCPWK